MLSKRQRLSSDCQVHRVVPSGLQLSCPCSTLCRYAHDPDKVTALSNTTISLTLALSPDGRRLAAGASWTDMNTLREVRCAAPALLMQRCLML